MTKNRFVVGFGLRAKKENGIRFVVAKNLFVVGFGSRTKKKKGNEIGFVVPKNLFVVGFGSRTKKKRNLRPFCRAQEFILRFDLTREKKDKKPRPALAYG